MFYTLAIYCALAVFGVGMLYRMSGWFRFQIGTGPAEATMSTRVSAALKGLSGVLFSPKLRILIRVFFRDVLLQLRIREKDGLRWIMHMLIFAGFMFLFFTHALDRIIHTPLADPYYLKLNPFLIVPGLMVLAGVALAVYRRFILKVPRLKTGPMDSYALIILAVIMLSGIAMELTKLTSYEYYQIFWNIHVPACLLGLAYLPFSKMLHVFTTPASLLANSVMNPDSPAANVMTRQVMELDACTRCCTCSLHCSVAVAGDSLGNDLILPSERMAFLKDYIAGKQLSPRGLTAIQQGVYLCTNCDRCTVNCPAGINLRDLWFRVREEMLQRGLAVPLTLTPLSFYRGLRQRELAPDQYAEPPRKAQLALGGDAPRLGQPEQPIALASTDGGSPISAALSGRAATFASCFTCENCSTVCPVAGNYDDPREQLDLLPHQIIRSLVLGLEDLAMGSKMLWYCLTCYQCQEHCPQGVKVTDIFYELKNLAAQKAARTSVPAVSGERAAH
jgi:heterodisulfide reductase subunit C/nitrate reductase gamma subunit